MTTVAEPQQRRTAVVTGGSRGIGLVIAERFVTPGATVFIAARNAEVCDAAAQMLGAHGECISVPSDVASEEGRRRLVDAVSERTDRLDVLINNAGATGHAQVDQYPPDYFDHILSVNLKAVFALTQAFPTHLRASAEDDTPARVINIGSITGVRAPPMENYAYS